MIHSLENIFFKGLTHSPSDYACQDGELGTCLNLIHEDGELHIIPSPTIEENFTLPDGAKIVFVHKVTHNNQSHTHYIIQNGNSIYWVEKGASYYSPTLIYSGSVNSVTSIGNILCFVEDSSTKYAYWKESKYIVFNMSDLNYTVNITDTMGDTGSVGKDDGSKFTFTTYLSEDEWNTSFLQNSGASEDETPDPVLKGASILFNSFDAQINKRMSELGDEWFKYLSFGVVALRLYDGTYINISNPFVLAPNAISNKFLYLKSKKTISSSGYLHKHTIRLDMSIANGLEDIIQGATVFLTHSESFIDTNKAPTRIVDKYNVLYNSEMTVNTCSGAFYFLEQKSALELIDSMQYYRSVDIDTEEFGKEIQLKTIQQVEESLPLADMKRLSYGGTCAITYNNRLHIANVKKSFFNAFDSYTYDKMPLSKGDPTFNWEIDGCYLNTHVEVGELSQSCLCDAVFEVTLGDTMSNKTLYYKGKVQYPIPPIMSFPDATASRMTIYLSVPSIPTWYKVDLKLHKSNTFGMSYYVHFGNMKMGNYGTYGNYGFDNLGLPQFMQYEKFRLKDAKNTISWWQDGVNEIFTVITQAEYNAALAKVGSTEQSTETYPSLIKVSEAENPLVFPAKNSVQVGSAQIQALAANTRPISEGQFGEAPLYVFTDEGVWMLMLGTEGTYQARQPVNRYICTDPDGILQIDDAVVYPTEQGIMLQSGSQTECITDALDGKGTPFDFTTLPSGTDILDVFDVDSSKVSYAYFRNFLLKARMIFDYYDRRIILFNPNYRYAYVYSLKSKEWGTMESNFSDRVNIYPDAFAVDNSNHVVNVYNPSPDATATYILCTRPITFGSARMKTIFDIYVNGFFPPNKTGKCGMALYGSNNLNRWHMLGTVILPRLQLLGTPYKFYRIALVGTLSAGETLSGFFADIQERWQNSIR